MTENFDQDIDLCYTSFITATAKMNTGDIGVTLLTLDRTPGRRGAQSWSVFGPRRGSDEGCCYGRRLDRFCIININHSFEGDSHMNDTSTINY